MPARDMIRLYDATCAPVDRTTVADPDGARLGLFDECRECGRQFRPNSFGSGSRRYIKSATVDEAPVCGARNHLQLRPANLDREVAVVFGAGGVADFIA